MRPTTRLRRLIEAPEIVVMPGVNDALSARIAAACGHDAITLGGFAATGVLLGEPDTSQLTQTEMAEHCARICAAVDLPLLADADTGFGNVTNVRRAVREFERAGVAGLFIEDQVFPKRCGHTRGKAVVPAVEMVAKIKAAVDARTDADLVIMARTDALAVNGIGDAIERINLCREAGADLLFVEAPRDASDMRRICRESDGPSLANMVDFGDTPLLDATALQALGYAAAVFPISALLATVHALFDVMGELRRTGTTSGLHGRMTSFDAYTALVGLPALRDQEQASLDAAARIVAGRIPTPAGTD